jgi:hypothetical protein
MELIRCRGDSNLEVGIFRFQEAIIQRFPTKPETLRAGQIENLQRGTEVQFFFWILKCHSDAKLAAR